MKVNNEVTNEELVAAARDSMINTYSPYSGFPVGAAVLTEDGSVYKGCNIENSSYGATNCAERTAIFNAVADGHRKIKKIAVVSSAREKISPCGICLQVMNEFMDSDGVIVLEDSQGAHEYKLSEFLPCGFDLNE